MLIKYVRLLCDNMKIKLYGLPACSRCTIAKMMLEKRGIKYEYEDTQDRGEELPILVIDGVEYSAKNALMKIRELKCQT